MDGDVERFMEKCEQTAMGIAERGCHKFLVTVDGSDASKMAFNAIIKMRKKYDFIAVFHAMKESKDAFLPVEYRPGAIRGHFEVELVSTLPASRYCLVMEDRGNRTFMETLQDSVSHYKESSLRTLMHDTYPDFIVFGVVGRKSSKSRPSELGSNALQALSALHYPIIVIKRPLRDGPLKYLYTVNASMQSKSGLDILLKIVKPRDTLILLHVMDAETPDVDGYLPDMKAYYERELSEYGPPDSHFRIYEKGRGTAITSAIVNYAEDEDPDFFVTAPRSKISVSSITEYIINHVSMSVVLCKI